MADEEAKIESLQNLLWLINDVDQLIEHAMVQHAPVRDVIPRAIDRLLSYIDASAVTVRVPDESGEVRTFKGPNDAMDDQIEELTARLRQVSSVWLPADGGVIYGQRLDLSIEFLGVVIAHFDQPHTEWERDHTQRALFHWAEIVDNYVAMVTDVRRKQQALKTISDGFKQAILENALDDAVRALAEYVDFDTLLLVCQSDEVLDRSTYSFRIVIGRETEYSSALDADPRVRALVESTIERLLRNETVDDVLEELNVRATHLEDVPIYDLDGRRIVGRVVVGGDTPITPFAADLVDRFADYLRQRVVDFSREWRSLSRTFAKRDVERLMREPDYRGRFLAPREGEVAILYTDIAGFTRLSETVLESPAAIGRLIDRWSRHVVEILWETGGVFDKMVGDCIIGLWGPPFYEMSPREAVRAAADAARRIRDYTAALVEDPAFPELAESPFPIGVASGLNFCSSFVGRFGPDENFTGFSSGMNNTARLQSLAQIDEILCMSSFVEWYDEPTAFSGERVATVKNVADPLKYHALLQR